MKKKSILALLFCFSLFSLAEKIIITEPEEIFLPIRTAKTWTLPPLSPKMQTLLEFEHRLNYPGLSGWCPMWSLKLNKKYFSATTDNHQNRLLNKPLKVPHHGTGYFPVCQGNNFYSLYSPDYEMGKSGFKPQYSSQAYRIVLDITDLLRENESNVLELKIGGSFLEKIFKERKISLKPGIAIRNFKIIQKNQPTKLKIRHPKEKYMVKGESLLDQPQEVALSPMSGEKWIFPAVKPDKRITVEFEHRIHHPNGGGWNAPTQLVINEKLINASYSRTFPRLLNKPLTTPHTTFKTFNTCSGYKWYSLYAPDFNYDPEAFYPYTHEAYRVVVDVTDLIKEDTENSLEIRFGASWMPSYYRSQKYNCEPSLRIRNVKVIKGEQPSLLPFSRKTTYIRMKQIRPPEYSTQETSSCLMLLYKNNSIPLTSSFSQPGSQQPLLFPHLQGSAENNSYKITRKSICRKNRIDFFDTFENKTGRLIGVKIRYEIPFKAFDQLRIGGDTSPENILNASGCNPSVYLGDSKKGLGIGLVAVDDVFRVQNKQYLENCLAGIRTDHYALSPGEKRTVEWSLYPMNTADYFDFINEIRKDWKVNFPIEGNFAFTLPACYRPSQNELKPLNQNLGIKYNATGCLVWRWIGGKYANYSACLHGSALFDDFQRGRTAPGGPVVQIPCAPMREMLKGTAAIARKHLQGTQSKALCYVHNQISMEIDDWNKYPDAAVTDAKGKPRCYGGEKALGHIFIPTPENSFGKKTFRFMKNVIDELGFDGIYNDEFSHCGYRITYRQWDKVSVELDNNNQVKHKIGYVTLLKLPFTRQILDEFLIKRKIPFVANAAPQTRTELKYHFPRFEETFYDSMRLGTHLYTPIQLGDQLAFPMTPQGMMDDIRHALTSGLLYYYYINRTAQPVVIQKMFPFTPLELHSGWLLGKEKILTIHSGEFGWYRENSVCVPYVSNQVGKTVEHPTAEIISTSEGLRCKLQLAENHCAVLVRLPVNAELSGNVKLTSPAFKNNCFTATLTGSGTLKLNQIPQGFFSKNNKTYKVNNQVIPISFTLK